MKDMVQDIPDRFRMTDLGILPCEWEILELDNIGKFQYGYTTSATSMNTGVKFLRITDINENGIISWQSVPYVQVDSISANKFNLKCGDILFARIGATTGKTCIIKESIPTTVFASYLIRFTSGRKLHPNYLFFYTQSKLYWDLVNSGKDGKLKKGLNANQLKLFKIPIPSLSEQKKIANVLSSVQDARDKTQSVIDALKGLKKSLMKHLFTYGCVPVEEADRVCLKETAYGYAPAHWKIIPLSQCAEVQTGVAKGRKLDSIDIISVPYLRVANVQDGYIDLSEIKYIDIRKSELNRYLIKEGDIVLTEGGDFDKLGRGFIWRNQVSICVHQNHVFAVRVNQDAMIPDYLAYMIQSEFGKKYFLGVAHKTTNLACINSNKLKNLPILIPAVNEQKYIVDSLSAMDQMVEVMENKKRGIDDLFKTLLHNLMTGKTRVNDLEV